MKIIEEALAKKQKALSEYESKKVLASYGIPVTREELVSTAENAAKIAKNFGFPVVLKGCSPDLTHKTEMNVIRLNLKNEKEVMEAFQELAANPAIPKGGILVQEMIKGQRELVIGMNRDPQFGPCVMFGLGGIFTEILRDVSFRVAPLEKRDALEMMEEIKAKKILDPFRGSPAVDKEVLAKALMAVGQIGLDNDRVKEIDINPVIIYGDRPVAVDALVVLES
ncbi:MAG: acetate--CoA ligase family protein [Candidatus Tectomicrobia bacterium]|uniref:Acetate--CoA ligase family protein n=1 Tax=Tectimicrobiota bacterium TaxID=2528274 RepID=A0A933GM94_UNCTE|nr:acetate--CoA ligase family protein [Candidatus Tectomicrobia bacterium]